MSSQIRNDRERDVLAAPDGYRIYFIQNRRWLCSPRLYNADEATTALSKVRALGYRAMIYASRVIDDEERLASVTDMELSRCASNSIAILSA